MGPRGVACATNLADELTRGDPSPWFRQNVTEVPIDNLVALTKVHLDVVAQNRVVSRSENHPVFGGQHGCPLVVGNIQPRVS